MKRILPLITLLLCASVSGATSLPDCSIVDEFESSVYGMLQSELLPIMVDFPEEDAEARFELGDYRLLGYGSFSGIEVPGAESLGENKICEYGVRIFPGMTDAFESSMHRILVEKLKIYIVNYNASLLDKLKAKASS